MHVREHICIHASGDKEVSTLFRASQPIAMAFDTEETWLCRFLIGKSRSIE